MASCMQALILRCLGLRVVELHVCRIVRNTQTPMSANVGKRQQASSRVAVAALNLCTDFDVRVLDRKGRESLRTKSLCFVRTPSQRHVFEGKCDGPTSVHMSECALHASKRRHDMDSVKTYHLRALEQTSISHVHSLSFPLLSRSPSFPSVVALPPLSLHRLSRCVCSLSREACASADNLPCLTWLDGTLVSSRSFVFNASSRPDD